MTLGLLGVAVLAYGLTAGFYPRFYTLEWDEDVQLHDGRVIVVHMRHTYERRHMGFSRYADAYSRDTEMRFDAGAPTGPVTQLFKGYHPFFLGHYDGEWYVTLYGSPYGRSDEMPGQDWRRHAHGCPPSAALVQGRFEPIPQKDLPAVFKTPNILVLDGEPAELAQFDGRHLSLQDKAVWLQAHPGDPYSVKICRLHTVPVPAQV